jgi:hypothetical protein
MPNTTKNAFAGFSVRAPSADGTATLSWIVEDPEVGYVDTGEDTCNTHLWARCRRRPRRPQCR